MKKKTAPPQTPAKEKAEAHKESVEAAKARLADRLLTKPEVCAIAHVSYPTLWQWMLVGKFPRSRIVAGRSMWVSTEVDAWLAALPIRPLKGDTAE
jgi:predicted DNA-binding transcriptional regulator AlpA